MAIFQIDSIQVIDAGAQYPDGEIRIKQGKITHHFAGIEGLQEMVGRVNKKPHDTGLVAACQFLLNLPAPALENMQSVTNQQVEY